MGKMIITYQMKSIEQTFGLEVDTLQIISNPMQIIVITSYSIHYTKLYESFSTCTIRSRPSESASWMRARPTSTPGRK